MKEEFKVSVPDWAWGMNCAVTVCDSDLKIIYMNQRSRDTFAKHGPLIGKPLLDCHSERSREIIRRLMLEGGTNAYTISKEGQRKLIFQTAWRHKDGRPGGLVELSMVIPEDMPHYVRG